MTVQEMQQEGAWCEEKGTGLREQALQGRRQQAAVLALVLQPVPAQRALRGLQDGARAQRGQQRAHHVLQRIVSEARRVRHRHRGARCARLHACQHLLSGTTLSVMSSAHCPEPLQQSLIN